MIEFITNNVYTSTAVITVGVLLFSVGVYRIVVRIKSTKKTEVDAIKKYGRIRKFEAPAPWPDPPEYRNQGGSPKTKVNVQMPTVKQPTLIKTDIDNLRMALYNDYASLISKLEKLTDKSTGETES